MAPPRVITLKANDVAQILGQVLDGQNLVVEKVNDLQQQNSDAAETYAKLQERVVLVEERLAVLMLAVAERRQMFQSIAKQTFIGLLKITCIVIVLAIMGVSFRDAVMRAIHP